MPPAAAITGRPVVTLLRRSIDWLPTALQLSRELGHDDLVADRRAGKKDTGFEVIG